MSWDSENAYEELQKRSKPAVIVATIVAVYFGADADISGLTLFGSQLIELRDEHFVVVLGIFLLVFYLVRYFQFRSNYVETLERDYFAWLVRHSLPVFHVFGNDEDEFAELILEPQDVWSFMSIGPRHPTIPEGMTKDQFDRWRVIGRELSGSIAAEIAQRWSGSGSVEPFQICDLAKFSEGRLFDERGRITLLGSVGSIAVEDSRNVQLIWPSSIRSRLVFAVSRPHLLSVNLPIYYCMFLALLTLVWRFLLGPILDSSPS